MGLLWLLNILAEECSTRYVENMGYVLNYFLYRAPCLICQHLHLIDDNICNNFFPENHL